MPWLQSDDDVRRLEKPWVGRWVTARFITWAIGAGTAVAVFPLLWLAIPTIGLAFGAAWAGGFGRRRDRIGLAFTGGLVVLAFALLPLDAAGKPLPWLMALLLAIVVGVIAARLIGKFVRYETPLRFWWATLHNEINAPRPGTPGKPERIDP